MLEYPKIDTLFDRGDKFKVNESVIRNPAFSLVDQYYVTEKIHGQNIRVGWENDQVSFATRNDPNPNGMPKDLLKFLEETFTEEKMKANFLPMSNVTIFGEGCGAGIQKGGGNYSKTKTFVMFDIAVTDELGFTWWMEPEDVKRMASTLGVQYVPELGMMSKDQIVKLTKEGFNSILAKENTGVDNHRSEGIIAKTVPGLLMRNGKRLMFKLKEEDFLK